MNIRHFFESRALVRQRVLFFAIHRFLSVKTYTYSAVNLQMHERSLPFPAIVQFAESSHRTNGACFCCFVVVPLPPHGSPMNASPPFEDTGTSLVLQE
jgi:hypothetical protein